MLVSVYLYKISLKWMNALERYKSERQELDNVLCKNECNAFTSKNRVVWYQMQEEVWTPYKVARIPYSHGKNPYTFLRPGTPDSCRKLFLLKLQLPKVSRAGN